MIKISNCEIKTTSTGKPYKTFNAHDGSKEVKASVWSDNAVFFEAVKEGAEVDGILSQNEKGYWNLKSSLTPPKFYNRVNPMKEAMERKEESIAKFQDNKEHAMRLSSTLTNATNLAIAQGKPDLDNVLSIRKDLWEKWEHPTDNVPF
jgi:hypothetical protein